MERTEVEEVLEAEEQPSRREAVGIARALHRFQGELRPVDPDASARRGGGIEVLRQREQERARRRRHDRAGAGQEVRFERGVVVGDEHDVVGPGGLAHEPASCLLQAARPPPAAGAPDDRRRGDDRGDHLGRPVPRPVVDQHELESLVGLRGEAASKALGQRPAIVDRCEHVDRAGPWWIHDPDGRAGLTGAVRFGRGCHRPGDYPIPRSAARCEPPPAILPRDAPVPGGSRPRRARHGRRDGPHRPPGDRRRHRCRAHRRPPCRSGAAVRTGPGGGDPRPRRPPRLHHRDAATR